MGKKRVCWAFLMAGMFLSALIWAQTGSLPAGSEAGLPYFNTGLFSTFDKEDGHSITRAYVQIVNDNLTFVKTDSGFDAEVQIELFLTKENQDFVFNRTISKKISVADYSETNDNENLNTMYSEVAVDSGKYEAVVTVTDKNSNKQLSQKRALNVSAPGPEDAGIALSDILFFSDYKTDDEGNITQFEPELTSNFSGGGKFVYAYFNSYSYDDSDSMFIRYLVKDNDGTIIQQNNYVSPKEKGLQEHFIRLNRYYFNRNVYTLEVSANVQGQWITKSNSFAFFWRYSPNSKQDLDMAIEYLRYIGRDDSIKYFRNKSFEEKSAYFQRFWRKRDPNPDTEENELMIEYYRRINFSNENFSATGLQGWLSDRGRIYVKFGQPDEVERHPFEAGSYPYVIWRYYSVRKTFLFVDRSGFGDYELHPNYYYVEYE